jgi:hypothetical protein
MRFITTRGLIAVASAGSIATTAGADIVEAGQINRAHPTLYAYYDAGDGLDHDPGTGLVGSWNNIAETTGDPFLQDLYRVIGTPLRISGAVNGLPSVGYDGLSGTWSPRDEFGDVFQPSTYCFVAKVDNAVPDFSGYVFDSSTSGSRNALLYSPSQNPGNWTPYAGVEVFSTEPVAEGDFQIHTLIMDTTGSVHFINGVEAYTGDVGDQYLWGLILGMRYSGTSGLEGEIAEFILYDERLGDTDRDAVERYLSDKYAIPLGADCPPDYNGDGVVNSQDFVAFLNDFVAGEHGRRLQR